MIEMQEGKLNNKSIAKSTTELKQPKEEKMLTVPKTTLLKSVSRNRGLWPSILEV